MKHHHSSPLTPVRPPAPALPEIGFLREWDVIGRAAVTPEQAAHNKKVGKGPRTPRPAIAPILPISHSCWWSGVRQGRFPQPVRTGRCTMWRAADIRRLLEEGDAQK